MNEIPFAAMDIPDSPQIVNLEVWFDHRSCGHCGTGIRFFIPHIKAEVRTYPDNEREYYLYFVECPCCQYRIDLSTYRYSVGVQNEIEAVAPRVEPR